MANVSGVSLALELMANHLSTPDALIELIEDVLESPAAGICLDVGNARLLGDPVDAIEAASGHIVAAHVHDTRGARVEHLVPYRGSIDWARTLLAFQKVGYSGPWTFELAPGPPAETLARAAEARQRFARAAGHQRRADEPMTTTPHVPVNRLGEHAGETVTIKGWLDNRRSSGKLHFLEVRDGTGIVQVVMGKNDVADDIFKAADHLPQETSAGDPGHRARRARAKGGFELVATGMEVVGPSREYPITPKEHGVDFLLDHRHLWLRSAQAARDPAGAPRGGRTAIRDFFDARGFTLVDAPIFTPAACEGTTHAVRGAVLRRRQGVPHADRAALHGSRRAMALGKVYCFGPTFRAEKSKTRRHLTEFWMVEPEVAYADSRRRHGRSPKRLVVERRRAGCSTSGGAELDGARARHREARDGAAAPFPRITYDEAAKLLAQGRRALAFQSTATTSAATEETVLVASSSTGRSWSPLPGGDRRRST